MKVKIEGYSAITGRPEVILNLMKAARIFDSDMSDEDYIETIRKAAWSLNGASLEVTGNTPAERAESLLRSMAENNMIRIEEEEQ